MNIKEKRFYNFERRMFKGYGLISLLFCIIFSILNQFYDFIDMVSATIGMTVVSYTFFIIRYFHEKGKLKFKELENEN